MKQRKLFNFILAGILCLAAAPAGAQPIYEWAKEAGGASYDFSNGIVVDNEGYVYTTGIFASDTIIGDFGGKVELFSNGGEDVFIIKQNSAGELIWAKSFGGESIDYSNAIAVDDSGNIYVTGSYVGEVDFDPGPGTEIHTSAWGGRFASSDFFVSKFDSSGNFLWVRVAGGFGSDQGNAIALDPASNSILIAGNFGAEVDFDLISGTVTLLAQSYDPFVLRVGSNGDLIWVKQFSGRYDGGQGLGIAIDTSRNIFITGDFYGTFDFDPDAANSDAIKTADGWAGDIYITKLDSTGKFIWAQSIGGEGGDGGNAITVDQAGNAYITGFFDGVVNFNPSGSYSLTSEGGLSDIFVLKLDKDGNFKWAASAGGVSYDVGKAIAVDELGNVYATGHFYEGGRIDFNPGLQPEDTFYLTSNGGADAFIWKLNNEGELIWAINIGSTAGGDDGRGIKVKDGYIYATGGFVLTADFDPQGVSPSARLTSNGYEDIYVLKLLDCGSFAPKEIEGPDSICIDKEYTYLFNTPGALSYTWELPTDWEGDSDSSSISVLPKGSGGLMKVTAVGKCDTVTQYLNVELSMPRVDINVNEFVLGTTNSDHYDTWQWYLEGQEINGATDSVLTVEENGLYSVKVTGGRGCVDTASYLVTNVSVSEHSGIANQIIVYPNPAKDIIYIHSSAPIDIALTNIEGRTIFKAQKASEIPLAKLSEGVYFLHIYDQGGKFLKAKKVVKIR